MGGNNCGIYILMYTLYMALGLEFDFTENDMPLIRKWWCAVLLDNFAPQIDQQCFKWAGTPRYSVPPLLKIALERTTTSTCAQNVLLAYRNAHLFKNQRFNLIIWLRCRFSERP
ncbi:uncharacterized protein [Misgurnus anguillicaudatus]|uniref:uncharacterized protein n=1 Tax=Misgurnus anguillicaudatus TaxID=75329 RepID=UPI003CCF64F0